MTASLIKIYGLRWHVERVAWTSAEGIIGLWGVPGRERRSMPVDFSRQSAIYVLYAGEAIVYVGQSGHSHNRLFARLKNHRADRLADRWDRFSWFGLYPLRRSGVVDDASDKNTVASSKVLDQIEAVMIEALEPRLNRQGGQFGTGVRRYLQVDRRLEAPLGG